MTGPVVSTSMQGLLSFGLENEERLDRWKMRKTKKDKIIKILLLQIFFKLFFCVFLNYLQILLHHSFPAFFFPTVPCFRSTLLCSIHLSLLIWFLFSVVDPYSFFPDPDPDPDPEFDVGDQYGSGSGFRIRIRIQYGSRALMTKNWKKSKFFFDQKLQFTYP